MVVILRIRAGGSYFQRGQVNGAVDFRSQYVQASQISMRIPKTSDEELARKGERD